MHDLMLIKMYYKSYMQILHEFEILYSKYFIFQMRKKESSMQSEKKSRDMNLKTSTGST